MTNNNQVNWDEIPEDVEAVFLHGEGRGQWQQWYKVVDGYVMVRYPPEVIYTESLYTTLLDRINDADAASKCYIRPPATTPPEENVTCKVELYEGELPEGMISLDEEPKPPSISTILREAQQSILKHHGVTGKVKFTVTCSE